MFLDCNRKWLTSGEKLTAKLHNARARAATFTDIIGSANVVCCAES